LSQLRDEHARIALVVDEYGDVEGLISLEDIIRELLGELSDEFKSLTGQTPMPLPGGRWRLPGRLTLEAASEWAQSLGAASFQSTHAETLAGWILEQLETVPAGALCLQTDEMALQIERMTGAAIESVIVWIPETVGGGADD
jgi:CBS domain containing-hemolysin-like protein